jgi:high affinity Mn2+ porin
MGWRRGLFSLIGIFYILPTIGLVANADPTTQPAVAIGTHTVPIDLPTLSGRWFDALTYSFHGQATIITQGHGDFTSPYEGPKSLPGDAEVQTSYSGTLFMGVRLPTNTEIYFDPEVDAGDGIGNVLGLGGETNGDAARDFPSATPLVAALFVRQTLGWGRDTESIADAPNQVAQVQPVNRVTINVGQFSVADYFDVNAFANDPRGQFFNWGFCNNLAWDYAANSNGYSQGAIVDLHLANRSLRYGIFRELASAGGGEFDDHWDRAFAQALEFEQRYTIKDQPGAVRPMVYLNFAHMGSYADALEQMPVDPNIIAVRSYSHPKYGFGINADQQITGDLGVFARAGWNNGQSESWTYAEVDRSLSAGLSLKGTAWSRGSDVVGVGGIISGLSQEHRQYLEAGGLGVILGDGRLNYAPEEVIETYYLLGLTKNIALSLDYQFINHPGFNADRGPVSVGAFRFHFEF